ncbi:MAG: hypothetical protein AAF488_18215 [Planctomycetota bacterium]
MLFGSRQSESQKKKGMPPAVRRQLMFQIVVLVMVLGVFWSLMSAVGRDDGTGREELDAVKGAPILGAKEKPRAPNPDELPGAKPPVEGSDPAGDDPAQDGDDSGIDLDVEVVALEAPQPYEDDPGLLLEAATREARGEVHLDSIIHLVHKTRTQTTSLEEQTPALSEFGDPKAWSKIVASPNRYRGQLIEIVGNVVAHKGASAVNADDEFLVPAPNPSGVPTLFRSFVHGQNDKMYLLTHWKNSEQEFRHMDGVRFRGYFAQIYTYDFEFKGETRKAKIPILVGGDFVPIESTIAEPSNLAPLFGAVITLSLIAGAVVLIVSWRSDRAFAARTRGRKRRGGSAAASTDAALMD